MKINYMCFRVAQRNYLPFCEFGLFDVFTVG